ncbi:MAG: hypothetical protein IPL05_05135 [Betaproteobacteria bacterium]|nr:hypothetical protein [Betaproteobacteria bacterium]
MAFADNLPASESFGVFVGVAGFDWLADGSGGAPESSSSSNCRWGNYPGNATLVEESSQALIDRFTLLSKSPLSRTPCYPALVAGFFLLEIGRYKTTWNPEKFRPRKLLPK